MGFIGKNRVLIVGQGLAGTFLAHELGQRGVSFLVIDDGFKTSSSVASNGLVNPVTGMRLAKSESLETHLPYAKNLYQDMEARFGRPFFHPMPILRVFVNSDEAEAWQKRLGDPGYQPFLRESPVPENLAAILDAPFGSGFMEGGGYLEIPALLGAFRNHLFESGLLKEERFESSEAACTDSGIRWKGEDFAFIVYCEGPAAINNPHFLEAPFTPVKGEMLVVQMEGVPEDTIINSGLHVIPTSGHLFRVGATFDREFTGWGPTREGRKKLEDDLTALLDKPFSVVEHYAGVRPATITRQPFIEFKKENPRVGIFNGLGSKGALAGPCLAAQLAECLVEKMGQL